MRARHRPGAVGAAAVGRSFDVYYRDAARAARMDALNATLAGPGDLVFDIGAHVGDRTGSFLRLGARVVALEPQPRVYRALRLIHGRHPRATLIPAAAGPRPGRLTLLTNAANPTVATADPGFVAAAQGAPGWEGQVWDGQLGVPVMTLDALIVTHGRPDFVKIDVEGYEAAVLAGLSTALPALSFEVTTIRREAALACIDRLEGLGRYAYALTLGEDHALPPEPWREAEAMRAAIRALPDAANSGDVHARLADGPQAPRSIR
jgi:FkbM family methyltransferase